MYPTNDQQNYFDARDDERNEHAEYCQEAREAAADYARRHRGKKMCCDRCGEAGIIGEDMYVQSYMTGFCDYELEVRHNYDCMSLTRQNNLMWAYIRWMADLNHICDQMESGLAVRCDECGARIHNGDDGIIEFHIEDPIPDWCDDADDGTFPFIIMLCRCDDEAACNGRVHLQEEGF